MMEKLERALHYPLHLMGNGFASFMYPVFVALFDSIAHVNYKHGKFKHERRSERGDQ